MPYMPSPQDLATLQAYAGAPRLRYRGEPRMLTPEQLAQNVVSEAIDRGGFELRSFREWERYARDTQRMRDEAEAMLRRSPQSPSAQSAVESARRRHEEAIGRRDAIAGRLERALPDIRAAEVALSKT